MKRIVAALLCAAILVACFAGCGKDSKKKKGDGSTITVGLCTSAIIEDYDTNALTKYLEKESGYNIEFQFFSSQSTEAKSQISTMLAAGEELPDILWGIDLGRDVYLEYGQDGYLLDLKEYFDDKEGKAKIFWDRFAELPEEDQESYKRTIVDVNTGAMYALPTYQVSEIDAMDYQMYINKTWLDKVGMKKPTNLDEFYNVLKAFKSTDLNGNGINDEIPLVGCNALSGDVINFIINQFIYFDDNRMFNLDDKGKLCAPFTTDEYRNALKYADKLRKEGLLETSLSLTQGSSDLRTILCPPMDANGKIDESQMLVGCFVGHPTLCIEPNNPAFYHYEGMNYWGICVTNPHQNSYRMFITADCENPDAAWDLCMCMYTKEASNRIRYGEKGKDWDDADKNTTSFIGLPAEIKILNQVFAVQNNSIWGNVVGTILIWSENEVTQIEKVSDWEKHKNDAFTEVYDNYYAAKDKYNPKKTLPALVYTTEENDQYSMTRSNCASLVTNSRSSFVNGQLDPNSDADWNSYLKQLDEQGLETWIELAQKAYDRQK